MKKEQIPLVFDIRYFSLDDGPGIRTTVFFKGCPLSCVWCHNPEGIKLKSEIVYYPEKCIHCGQCEFVCPNEAIYLIKNFNSHINKCNFCGACTQECPTKAISIIGKYYTHEELVECLLSEKVFYQTSGGGVTFSGGEPTLFMDYLSVVMSKLKNHDIHIAIQTAGSFNYNEFKEKLLQYVDLIFFDLKLFNNDDFRRYIGGSNKRQLENFIHLCKDSKTQIVASVPLIPGITSTKNNLKDLRNFISASGCHTTIFRRYNPGGMVKRISIYEKSGFTLHAKKNIRKKIIEN